MKWSLFLLFLVLATPCYALINEIMYNPLGIDNNKEFIEFFSNEITNLTGYILKDSGYEDNLTLLHYHDCPYSLIVEEGFNYSGIAASIYSAGLTIGNNLGNEWDLIILEDNSGNLVDAISYYDSWGADGNGHSLCKIQASNEYFTECDPTPGAPNYEMQIDYSSLKITEFLPDPEGYDNAPMPDGEWVELYNSGNEPIDIKGLILNDNYGNGLNISDVNVADSTIINPHEYLIVYKNGNGKLTLNNDGPEKVILSSGNIVIDIIDYSDSVEGNSYAYLEGIGWQNTKPTPGEENIKYYIQDSSVKIERIYDLGSDNKAKFGQTIRVKVNIYKGDTTKQSVKLWIKDDEKISKETKTNLYTKYTNYTLALPVQIKPNCNGEFEDGKYYVELSGLDDFDKKTIYVEGNLKDVCDETNSGIAKFEYNFLSYPATIYSGKEFITQIEIKSDNHPHELSVWSYVYRGSKCYSGEREENKQRISLPAKSSVVIDLKNTVPDAKSGDYKLKVKIKKDEQKTLKELTGEISVGVYSSEAVSVQSMDCSETKCPAVMRNTDLTGLSVLIYESPQAKAEKLVVYLMLGLLALTTIFLTFKKY